jgi:hypothetical protein
LSAVAKLFYSNSQDKAESVPAPFPVIFCLAIARQTNPGGDHCYYAQSRFVLVAAIL